MTRKTISLNGTWDVIFDDQEKLGPDCFRKGRRKTHAVEVPGAWEQVRPYYDGVGFYRRTFDMPEATGGRRVHLRFGAVNYFAEVFLNGRKIGEHEGGYTPFAFDVTRGVRPEGNELVVRVIDPPRKRRIRGFRSGAPLSQSDIPTWKAGWYYNFGGIWQPVEIVLTEPVYVDDVYVQPQADLETVKFEVSIVNRGKAGTYDVAVEMTPKKGDEQTGLVLHRKANLKRGTNTLRFTGKAKRPHLWSPDDPFLYTATVTVSAGGRAADRLAVTCGIRLFTTADGVFKLNGRRVALRGFLQQGVYPRTIVLPASRAEVRRELMMLKRNGMNFVRAHLKPPPIFLDLADEVGMLLLEEPPIGWIENTADMWPRAEREVRELVLRDRNRPSVVMWGLLNEATHYRSFTAQQLTDFTALVSKACRAADATRLMITNSGGVLGGETTESTVEAYLPFEKKSVPLHDLHAYCAIPLSGRSLERYRAHGEADKAQPDGVNFVVAGKKNARRPVGRGKPALLISEFGAFENPPDFPKMLARYSAADRRLGLEDYAQHHSYWESLKSQFRRAKLGEIFGSAERYIRAAQRLHGENVRAIISAMRANPRNSGWVFTQLADASGEMFGATDLWRQPRLWFKDMCAACATPLVVPHVSKRVVLPRETLGLNLRLVNEDRTGQSVAWKLTVRDARAVGAVAAGPDALRGWVQEVLDEPLEAPARPGRYTVEAELRSGRDVLSTNAIRFTVMEPAAAPADRIGMFDLDNEIRPALEALGVRQIDKGGNNYRHKNVPCVYVMRPHHSIGLLEEYNNQLRRIVELGGAALVLEPITPMLYKDLLPKIIRLAAPMRNLIYMRPSPIWDGLPTTGGFADYEFADLFEGRGGFRHNADDVLALGGTSVCGGLCPHMWTDPDVYQWGSLIDVIRLGRGHLVFSQFRLVAEARTNPMAARLLANLVRYTASLVKRGGERRLLSRCIDPLNE